MSAFSYHLDQPFILDSFHSPLFPQQAFGEMASASPCFLYHQNPDPTPSSSATEVRTHERESPETDQSNLDYSPSVVIFDPYISHGEISEPQGSMENKRKASNGICISSSQSKGTKESRSRKQKKLNDGEKKKTKADEKKEKKACDQEPPQGYIHVRARRGQATDSHSLAERVRREKISERMKLLQALVPGCDKVTGKALMLDEIINYVQSLQNQVEFLSMKLASVSPTLMYNFGVDFDGHMNQLEIRDGAFQKPESLSQDTHLLSSVHQGSPFQSRACEDVTRSTYHIMDTSATFLLHGQGPIAFPPGGGNLLMQVGEQRQGFPDQVQVSSRISFQ